MDRRTFLKTLAALGASIALPHNLATASPDEVDLAWKAATNAWGLFEVDDYGTLSFANFEEPATRRDAYDFSGASDIGVWEVERHPSLQDRVMNCYRDELIDAAEIDSAVGKIDYAAIDAQVEERWAEWFESARGCERMGVDAEIEAWLGEEPDWCNEVDELYKTGNAQGAAYQHFLGEDRDIMDALGIVIIEGDCPGSSYFAARMDSPAEQANQVAEANGWAIRFV